MIYYLNEMTNTGEKHAGPKARCDVIEILDQMGAKEIRREVNIGDGLQKHIKNYTALKNVVGNLSGKNDILVLQYPLIKIWDSIFLCRVIKKAYKKGVEVVILIHDVDGLRYDSTVISKKRSAFLTLRDYLMVKSSKYAHIVFHNEKMKKYYVDKWKINEKNTYTLKIFDYLADKQVFNNESYAYKKDCVTVSIAGNLKRSKCRYIYELPAKPHFNLYGVGYEEESAPDNVSYMGSFMPSELPHIIQGTFGLVWDGDSAKTCAGSTGNYLRYNNPHKTSLYLSSGMPVIIWDQAAMADFIKKENIGIVVSSLADIESKIDELSAEEYDLMRRNAVNIGRKLRDGYYFKSVMDEIIKKK